MTATTYTVTRDGDAVLTRSRKEAAIALAKVAHGDAEGRSAVAVVTGAGTEVFRLEPIVTAAGRAKPFGRTETPNFEFEPVEGFTPAYARNRIKTVVFRANDRSGWLVVDFRPEGGRFEVANTNEARAVTNRLQQEARQAKAQAIADAKAAKEQELVAA